MENSNSIKATKQFDNIISRNEFKLQYFFIKKAISNKRFSQICN